MGIAQSATALLPQQQKTEYPILHVVCEGWEVYRTQYPSRSTQHPNTPPPHHSQLTTHNSQLTTHNSQLTTALLHHHQPRPHHPPRPPPRPPPPRQNLPPPPRLGRLQFVLHLHRLDHHHALALDHLVPHRHQHSHHPPRHRSLHRTRPMLPRAAAPPRL